jgi:hypothetical protein
VIVFVFCLFSKDEHVLPAKNDDVTSKNVPFVLRMKIWDPTTNSSSENVDFTNQTMGVAWAF